MLQQKRQILNMLATSSNNTSKNLWKRMKKLKEKLKSEI